jgi:predicted amidohydrolase YtcJ
MPKQLFFIILVCILMLTTFSTIIPAAAETLPKYDTNNTPADFIYFNGNFVTMDEKNEDPKFVAVKNGIIIAVSRSVRDFSKLADSHTQWINLNGKTMIPGLVDGHSHFSETAYRVVQGFNISPPPFGNVTSIAQLLDALRTFITTKNIPPGQSINGSGYSDLDMVEKRHPTRYELDSVSAVNPIVLTHFSGHIVVANSLALEKVNYTSTASAPAGGILDTFPNGTLTGICREYALLPLQAAFTTNFAQLTPEQIQLTVNEYFKSGVTTVQDMLRSEAQAIKYHSLGDNFPLDINAYYWVTGTNLTTFQRIVASYNTTRFRTRGAKFILDGSIQAFTALLTQPYWVPQS